jgi:hypothetical protein
MTLQRKANIYNAGFITGVFISIAIASFSRGTYIIGTLMLLSAAIVHMGTMGANDG